MIVGAISSLKEFFERSNVSNEEGEAVASQENDFVSNNSGH